MLEPAMIRATSSMDRFFSSTSRLCEGGEQRRARGLQRCFGLGRLREITVGSTALQPPLASMCGRAVFSGRG